MAEKRMFSPKITRSDAFISMPASARLLYYDLSLDADDDGFVDKPKSIMRMTGASDDDFTILVAKSFIIQFQGGVIVIKHWWINNYIRNDRYKPTSYIDLKDKLEKKENGAYTLKGNHMSTNCLPSGSIEESSVEESNVDKSRVEKSSNSMSTEVDEEISNLPQKPGDVDYLNIMDYWNKHSLLKDITAMTDKRKSGLNARIKEYGVMAIYKAIDNIANSKFLRGYNSKGWTATFDWVFLPNNFVKVLEGNYLDKAFTSNDEIKRRLDQISESYGEQA